jgi:hypothetical protein
MRERNKKSSEESALAHFLRTDGDTEIIGTAQRLALLSHMEQEIWESEHSAGVKRSKWHNLARVGAAFSAVGGAASASALIAHLRGDAGAVIGWSVLVVALATALFAGLNPEGEYARNRIKNRQYERLRWDIVSYRVFELPQANDRSVGSAIRAFAARREAIGSPELVQPGTPTTDDHAP